MYEERRKDVGGRTKMKYLITIDLKVELEEGDVRDIFAQLMREIADRIQVEEIIK
jgi:hypothetical protein